MEGHPFGISSPSFPHFHSYSFYQLLERKQPEAILVPRRRCAFAYGNTLLFLRANFPNAHKAWLPRFASGECLPCLKSQAAAEKVQRGPSSAAQGTKVQEWAKRGGDPVKKSSSLSRAMQSCKCQPLVLQRLLQRKPGWLVTVPTSGRQAPTVTRGRCTGPSRSTVRCPPPSALRAHIFLMG